MTENKEERVLSVIEKIIKEFTDGVSTNGDLAEQLYDCIANKQCTKEEFTDELMFMFSIKKDEILDEAHKALHMLSPFYDGEYDDEDDDCDECECICDDCKKNSLN
jgi:hypothetical protein